MKTLFFILAALPLMAQAEIKTQTIDYKQGDTVLEGFLAYDTALAGKRPGVLLVHDWMGLRHNAKENATKLAKLGYVAFAVDIYGRGVRPTDPKIAGETSSIYKNNR